MNEHTPHELSRRAVLSLLGVGGVATVGSIYSKVSGSHRASARSRESLTEATRDEWAHGVETTRAAGAPVATPRGSTIGFLYVPRLRDRVWGFPIVEGTDPKTLNVGIGHLTPTALPGRVGNVALFGHRTSSGKPFEDFDELVAGDSAIIETKDSWLSYELVASATVLPDAMWVAQSNPLRNATLKTSLTTSAATSERVLSLITCTPKYSTKFRLVWWATQTARSDHANPPSAISTT